MSFYEDFKAFSLRGNVTELAIAVVIGAAFGRIVTSLVNDLLMPPIGILIGGIDFSEFVITLREATADSAAVTINYGLFIQHMVSFAIIAFVIFMIIKGLEQMRTKEEEKPVTKSVIPAEEKLLTEIRDLLKAKEE